MPRVLCYFDDVHGYPWGDFNGARLAIGEYNASSESRKLAQIHGLRYLLPKSQRDERWPEAMYVAHAFDHPGYAEPEGTELVKRLNLSVAESPASYADPGPANDLVPRDRRRLDRSHWRPWRRRRNREP
jgi:hypothetical protein